MRYVRTLCEDGKLPTEKVPKLKWSIAVRGIRDNRRRNRSERPNLHDRNGWNGKNTTQAEEEMECEESIAIPSIP